MKLSFVSDGDGPPVVILHGLFGSGRNWAGIAKQLAASRRVYLVDARNHGESPWADTMTYAEMAQDVARTLSKHGVGALTVQVKVRYSDFTTLTRQIRLDDPVSQEDEIYRIACFLLARHRLVTSPLRLLGIGVSTLVPPSSNQLRLPL